MFYKGDGKAGEGNSRDFFFCMQEPSFLESEEKRIAASEGLSCDTQNLCKINHIYMNCKYLSSKSKLYHSKV